MVSCFKFSKACRTCEMLTAIVKALTQNSLLKHFQRNLNVVFATFGSMTMFKQQPLSFMQFSKYFFTQNNLLVIPNNILCFTCLYRSCFAQFETRKNRGKHNFEKQYCCRNYSDDVYQCLNTDQILLRIHKIDNNNSFFQRNTGNQKFF